MRKGSTYSLSVTLTDTFGEVLDTNVVDTIEFLFGSVRKTYPQDVLFDQESKMFIVQLSQADTFKLDQSVNYQARVKFADGSVVATEIYQNYVFDSLSKEVL